MTSLNFAFLFFVCSLQVVRLPLLQVCLGTEPDTFTLLVNLVDDKVTEPVFKSAFQLDKLGRLDDRVRVKELNADVLLSELEFACDFFLLSHSLIA